ncbi:MULTISPECIES: hypothetical protein [unclassified Coleofasciculus]|uniref:hypothetical protein n=3 Tax=Cyanobacteriota TaxID=1117 RepID=UPI0016850428|nr:MULTISPECIES: hypothetical protein [unclassified Coleofasciculus]MBD1837489.1 hypothetical protein [Coleofasciculus sp. FACHB-501]MBD1880126.1 hypothetical protein [Coleofasciculus sp. FACHB-T130]MBD2086171.1 hypothetical protein [Coleofasciculus sp. FACHB-542]
MLNKFYQQFMSRLPLEVPALGLLLTMSFATSTVALQAPTSFSKTGIVGTNSVSLAQMPASDTSVADGIYLYGSSQKTEEIGQEYIVFEARQGKVRGAFYMPSSEYSCFSGKVGAQQINLTVQDPYDSTTYSHSIALSEAPPVASADSRLPIEDSLRLQGYHPINKISANDQQILNACKVNF